MGIRQSLEQIMAVQKFNAQIQQEERDKNALYLDVDEQNKLIEGLTLRLDEGHRNRIESQKQTDSMELKVLEAQATIVKLDTQLNVTKRQDDYDTILQSILSHKADISRWEDSALEQIQKTEDLQREESDLASQIEAQKQTLRDLEESVAERAAAHEARIAELARERDALRAEIDENILAQYERLADRRGITALVPAKDRICNGCFSLITKQTLVLLMRDAELVTCTSCSRMLMLVDESLVPDDENTSSGMTND